MTQAERTAMGKKFFVHLAGKTNDAHQEMVDDLKRAGQTEVSILEESDYVLLFCPIASGVGTDISEALENMPGGKTTILVVMHHTFKPNHIVAPSSRQVTNPNVVLTVDCLFYEGKLLQCDLNDIATHDIMKSLGVSYPPRTTSFFKTMGKKFFVHLAGKTNHAHQEMVDNLKRAGHTEVSILEESDYVLLFCPIASGVGTDISEALENMPGGKRTILVVMHHTFKPNHIVAPSSRQVTNPNVVLTVDCLFYEGKFLQCDLNDIATHDIMKSLGVSYPPDSSWTTSFFRKLQNPWVLGV